MLFKSFYAFWEHFLTYPCFPLKWKCGHAKKYVFCVSAVRHGVRCPSVRVFHLTLQEGKIFSLKTTNCLLILQFAFCGARFISFIHIDIVSYRSDWMQTLRCTQFGCKQRERKTKLNI